MVSKPVQSAPSFNAGLQNPMQAHLYFVQAKQAYAAQQWQQVCVFAQGCLNTARQDQKLQILAKELLAPALIKLDQVEQALAVFVELNQIKPNDPVLNNHIGLTLKHLQRYEEATQYFQKAVDLAPKNIEFYMNLGFSCYGSGDFAQAKASFQMAENLDPRYTEPKFGRALSFQAEGRIDDAMAVYEQVLELEPTYLMALSNMIFLHYCTYPFDIQSQMDYLQRFGAAVGNGMNPSSNTKSQLQSRSPLRIGFISADLSTHPVGYFLESTMEQLNLDSELSAKLVLVAYANQSIEDETTHRLQSQFDLWRRVDTWSDDSLVEQIKQDKIDILIDLSGHTRGNRLSVFAKKPAPLQVSWLGYFGSTGLPSIDYVLADSICVPQHEESWFKEKVWRLPHLRYCFSVPHAAPEVSMPPCVNNQVIVFACYQMVHKINQGVMQCWMRILEACPTARLRIQSKDLDKIDVKENFISRLKSVGLDLQRIEIIGYMPRIDYFSSYSEVDILLDTFPFPGGTTTAEALWMGVPTLTLSSTGMLGRQGEALMVNAGLPDWVAYSEEEYVQKAIDWGHADLQQRQELATLRAGMRELVKDSPVFNAKQFAGDFVAAMHGMWQAQCES